jgi:hypothetical protein
MSKIDLEASFVRWNALLGKPLFSGPPHREYVRHKLAVEIIFSVLLPQWGCSPARTEIYPRVKIPSSIFYEWKGYWQQDPMWHPCEKEVHGKHHRTFSDEEELEFQR